MSGNERVTTVDDTGRDRADWDRIEQVLLQQPPAATASDTATAPREGERTIAAPSGADTTPERDPAATPPTPAAVAPAPQTADPGAAAPMTTADVATAGERPADPPAARARPVVPEAGKPSDDDGSSALFGGDEAEAFRSRWNGIQAKFVDDPRETVHEADALVAEVMKQLASTFAAERSGLEAQWSRGDDVSTEDLRQALRRYRSFFDRLLSF